MRHIVDGTTTRHYRNVTIIIIIFIGLPSVSRITRDFSILIVARGYYYYYFSIKNF